MGAEPPECAYGRLMRQPFPISSDKTAPTPLGDPTNSSCAVPFAPMSARWFRKYYSVHPIVSALCVTQRRMGAHTKARPQPFIHFLHGRAS